MTGWVGTGSLRLDSLFRRRPYSVLKERSARVVESCTEFSFFSDACLVPDRRAPPPRDCLACGRSRGGHVVTVRTQTAALAAALSNFTWRPRPSAPDDSPAPPPCGPAP